MKVVRLSSAESYEPEKDWKRVSLCNEKDISIEHFIKPPHHASPVHDHPNSQVLVVLKGKLAIVTDGSGELVLEEGDAAHPGERIPCGEKPAGCPLRRSRHICPWPLL